MSHLKLIAETPQHLPELPTGERGKLHTSEEDGSVTYQPFTVLIVDDNPDNLGLLFETLQQTSYKVLLAQDGLGALEQATNLKPDIILLDINMSGMNGFETCRRFKANPQLADIPIIFLTVSTETSDKVRGFDVGGVDYLTKPVNVTELLARLNTHLTLRNLQQQLSHQNQQLTSQTQQYASELQVEQDKRRLYQRERHDLMDNMQEQNKSIQQLSAQIITEHQQSNHILAHVLQNEVDTKLASVQATLSQLEQQPAQDTLAEQLNDSVALLNQTRQNIKQVIQRLSDTASSDIWSNPLMVLSDREREVLRLVAQGHSNQDIATQFGISDKTVRVYRSRIMQKLEIDNVPSLIKFAIKHHLVDLTT